MSDDFKRPTRRNVSGLLAGVAALWLWPGSAPAGGPKDQGIGGTGVAPLRDEKDPDRGIGGTGVIGTIQRFGSIFVNGLRITYPRNAQVYLDGQKGSIADLKIGQVVRVVASGSSSHLSTRRINVTSEVVGQIERVSPDALNVLGQTVLTHGIEGAAGLQVGNLVAVSGLRRPDGIIVASLIEPRPQGSPSVTGPVSFAPDGRMMVADLPLTGADPALVGHRAMFSGHLVSGGIFQVTQAENEGLLLGASVRRLSIEAYVDRGAEGLRLGSGLQVTGGRDLAPGAPAARAVIGASVDRGGRLVVDTIRAEPAGRPGGGTFGPGRGGSGGAQAVGQVAALAVLPDLALPAALPVMVLPARRRSSAMDRRAAPLHLAATRFSAAGRPARPLRAATRSSAAPAASAPSVRAAMAASAAR